MAAAPVSLGTLWAMHISDGVLTVPWLGAGFLLAGLLALAASYRVRDEEIPRIALLSAAFFVATLMHLPLGPTRVHLLLNGLVGIVLGRRAPLAILIGLELQAALLGHGGFYTVGVNTCVMALPALLIAALFAGLRRLPWFDGTRRGLVWLCGCLLGMIAVFATLVLQSAVLLWGGAEDWRQIVWLIFYAHLPIVALEGIVLGFTVSFLARVKPEMLGLQGRVSRVERELPANRGDLEQSAQPKISSPVALLLAALTFLFTAAPAHAHRPQADYTVRADRQVQIDGWFDPGDTPMKGAKVQVFRPGQRLLIEGVMDEKGTFVFRVTEAEELEVIVNAGAGHRTSLVIPREELGQHAEPRVHPQMGREQVKDALIGISFLLSLAAFVLSWRTSRRLRQLETRA